MSRNGLTKTKKHISQHITTNIHTNCTDDIMYSFRDSLFNLLASLERTYVGLIVPSA